MDDDLKLLDAVRVSLGLDAPLHPWGLTLIRGRVLEEVRPPMPVVLDPVLAPAMPLPYDVDPELARALFPSEDHARIEAQLDDAYARMRVLDVDVPEGVDDEAVVWVQLGVPLIGRERAAVRVRTRNLYRDTGGRARPVTGEFHAIVDLDGGVRDDDGEHERALAAVWPRWVQGRSPGLPARVDLNAASETQLLRLPGVTRALAAKIVGARPYARVQDLLRAPGIGEKTLQRLDDWVCV